MNIEEQIKAFEDYEHSKKMDCDRAILFRRWEDCQLDDDEKHYVGKYIDSFMQEKSELWLASANREGYKLVPVELIKSCNDIAVDCFNKWDIKKEAMPGICELMQDFSYYLQSHDRSL